MLVSLASCSVDDVEKPEVITADKTTAYAKVAISMPKDLGTRSEAVVSPGNTGTTNVGEEEESTIESISLAFYDENDLYVGKGELITELSNLVDEDVDEDAKVFEIKLLEGASVPTQVVAFINTDLLTVGLGDLKTNGKTYTDSYKSDDGFIMTNAGYYSAGEYVVSVPIDYENDVYHDLADAADFNVIEINVERLAAKITVKDEGITQNGDDANYTVVDVNGTPVKLVYTPKFWGATGTAQKENYVKTQFTSNSWSNGANRSYWAESIHYEKEITDYLTDNSEDAPLHYLTFGQIAGTNGSKSDMKAYVADGSSDYVLEHTSKKGFARKDALNAEIIATTYVIVTGNYEVFIDGSEDADNVVYRDENDNVDFYLLLDGMKNDKMSYIIFNKSQLIGKLLSYNGITQVKTTEDGDPTEVKDFEDFTEYFTLVYDYAEKKYVIGEALETLYDQDGNEIKAEDMTKSSNSRHYYFPDGGAYFNVPIAQYKNGNETTYGVVRNHSYVLTITNIVNLGAPLDDETFKGDDGEDDPDDKPVIPDPNDSMDNYINAKITVLPWHVINNGVTL